MQCVRVCDSALFSPARMILSSFPCGSMTLWRHYKTLGTLQEEPVALSDAAVDITTSFRQPLAAG